MKRIVLLLILLGLLGGGAYLYLNGNQAVTRAAETIASDALGVPVRIGSIELSLRNQKATVRNLSIGNPPGFTQPHAIEAAEIAITLASASRTRIDFKDITVKGSVVYFEVNERGMNVLALKDLAARKEQRQKAAAQPVKVVIERMRIDPTTIRPSVSLLAGDIGPITMPALTLTGVGQGRTTSAGDAIVQILDQYLALVAKQARESSILKHVPNMQDIEQGTGGAIQSIRKLF